MKPLDNTLEKINIFRKSVGLKPITKKVCTCLLCQKTFKSMDYPRQRLCTVCRNLSEDIFSQDSFKFGL